MAIILKNAPKTEEGCKLNLSKEDEEKYKLVFRINKESEKLDLYGVWNPKEIYGNEYVIAPLTSIYKDTQYLECGTKVQNVEGSTGDEHHANTKGRFLRFHKVFYFGCKVSKYLINNKIENKKIFCEILKNLTLTDS